MRRIFGRPVFSPLAVCLFLLTLTSTNFTQDLDEVTISGRISDSNGLSIVGATITLTKSETGAMRTAITNQEGRYRIIELSPGSYRISAAADGFGSKEQSDLETISGQSIQLDMRLDPAGIVVEPVTVSSQETGPIDTTRTVVGGTITEREIEDLPNNSRDALDLVFTLGGVTEEPLSTRDLSIDKGTRSESAPRNSPEEVGVFALSGGVAYSNNITIDGFDNNDDRIAGFRFQPSVESIREVQVITNQFSAEYGRASGGRVNILTRSGSRNLRGRMFYFFRDDNLNANSWSNNRRNIARLPLRQYVPGFTLGGPIPFGYFHNRTFFYAAYEYDHTLDTTVTDTYVPLVQNPLFPLPVPNTTEVITDFPGTTSATNLGRFIQPTDTPRRRQIMTARIDHKFSDNNYLTFNYQFGKTVDKRQFSGGNRLAEALIGKRQSTRSMNFTHNYVFNARAVNNFRIQYSTLQPQLVADGQFAGPVVLISFREPALSSNTTLVSGSSTLGSSDRSEKRWQIQNSFNYLAGNQTIRFGFDLQSIDSTYIDLTDASGSFTFASPLTATTVPQCLIDPNNPASGRIRSGAQAYTRGCVTRYRQNFFTDSTQQNKYYGLLFQDEWRVWSNFLLNFGIRYERETIIDDVNNFAPRFAIAWAPVKTNKQVIRFGGGMFYNRVLLRTVDDFQRSRNQIIFDTNRIASAGRDAYLQQLSNNFPAVLKPDSPLVQQYIAGGLNNNPFFRSLDPNLRIPESYQFNLGYETELKGGFVFEANLTYNRTIRLWREKNTNAPIVPSGFADLADYLANGITSGTSRFEFAGAASPDSRTVSGVTFYNLDSQNSSTASSTPYGRARAIANTLRPNPAAGQTEQVGSIGNSSYRGLVVELRRRYGHFRAGFSGSARIAYTFSYLGDDGIVNTSSAQTPGDFASERSQSLLDRRHRLAISGLFDLPKWLGSLRFSPIFRFGSSAPFNLSNGGSASDDRNLDDVNTDRPNYSGSLNDLTWRRVTDPVNPAVLNGITLAPIGRSGNLPRNAGKGPRQYFFDLNISRVFRIGERLRFRPEVEIGNVFNITVYSFGSEFIDASFITSSPSQQDLDNFLVPTRSYRPRQVRLGLKIDF